MNSKWVKRLLSLALATCAGFSFAAAPLAVWDGDFGTATKGSFTLDAKDNDVSSGSLVINQSAGAVFTGPNSSLDNSTFIIKGNNLNLASETAQYLLTVHQNILGGGNGDASYNKVGCSLSAENGGVQGIWGNALYTADTADTLVSEALSGVDSTLVVNIQVNGGVFVYEIVAGENGENTLKEVYKCTVLKSSNTHYKGFAIGGIYEKTSETLAPATGWQIDKLAVFGSTLSSEDILNYKFPSELTIYTATVSADGIVWNTQPPETLGENDVVRYVGSGSVTLDRDITTRLEIGDGVTLTPPADGITGFISIEEGGVLELASGSWLSQAKVSNLGIIRITGGTMENPVVINDDGAKDTSFGTVAIASGAVLKNIANDNKVFKVAGEGSDSTFIMSATKGWGMSSGTQIRDCTVIVQDREFWLERNDAFDETVDLVLNQKLHIGNPALEFTLGSLSGSGDIVLNGSAVTLSVNMTREDFRYSGDSAATLNVGGSYPLVLDPGADEVQNIPLVSTSGETASIQIASGTVNLGTSRPRISALTGVAKLVMSVEEQALGVIELPFSLSEAPDKALFDVFKSDGETSAVWVETDPLTLADGILTLRFSALEPITESGTIPSIPDGTVADLAVSGGEEGIELVFDKTIPSGVTLVLSGKVVLKTTGSVTELPANLTVQEGAEITLEAPLAEEFAVPANTTFILTGGADAENQKTFGSFTVPANATLKTKGHLAVTLASNNGTFDVLDGVATVTAGAGQAIKGTVYVRRGAEFVNVTNDAVAYSGATIVHVYGVLNMNTSRWTVGDASMLHLYAGCEVKGTGDLNNQGVPNGIIDFYRGGEFVQVHLNPDDPAATTAVFSGLVRVRNNEAKVKIDSGAYVNFNGGIGHASNEGRKLLTRTGAGGFIGTNYLKGVILDLGAHSGVKGRFVSASGENKLIIEGSYANSFCGDDSKDDPVIKVEPDSTLTLAMQDYSGWNGDVTGHGWIVNNGTLKLAAKGAGSRFFREHIIIGDGATTIVEQNTSESATERAQILYGGAPSEDLAQIQLPTGAATISTNGTAAAKIIYLGNDGVGGYGTKGAGISVGNGAELTLEPTIKGPDGITKWGDGALKFTGPMDEYTGTLTLNGGTISIAPGCDFTGTVVTDVEMKAVSSKTESDGTVVYRLSADYLFIRVR